MKYIAIIMLFTYSNLAAQVRFNHQFNLDYSFEAFTSVLPTDSCYYVTGVITNFSGLTIGSIFIKLDTNGVIEFEKVLSSTEKSYESWLGDLLQTNDGGFLDVCVSRDSTNKIMLLKYNDQGDTIFTKEFFHPLYPEESFLYVAQIIFGNDGLIWILCGVDVDPNGANGDNYILKLTQDGELVDAYLIGGSEAQEPFSMVLDEDGGVIIGSRKTNEGQVSENFFSRIHVFKLDENGDVKWDYVGPFNQLTDSAKDLILSSDGGVVACSGRGIEHWVNSETGQLRWHSYIFKLNSSHQLEWETELRGYRHSSSTGLVKIVEAHDGSGFIATGRLIEDVSLGEQVFGSWLVKVSPQGDSLWARYYSIFDDIVAWPNPYDLKNTPDGGYIIVGETQPYLPGGQAQRAWMMKLDEHGCLIPGCEEGDTVILASGQAVEVPLQLAIYPNPTSDLLNFQLRTARPVQAATFRITDLAGRPVREIQSAGAKDTHIVPVQGWSAGVYFLQYLEDGQVRAVERFVVE